MKRVAWIDTLRVIACFCVFWSHIIGAVIDFSMTPPEVGTVSRLIFQVLLKGFLNGEFWVCIFCIISGYLCSNNNCRNMSGMCVIASKRYLRLLIPIAFANLFAFIIQNSVGFYNGHLATAYCNEWLGNFYSQNVSLCGLIKSTAFFGTALNGPLWMIRYLFIGNLCCLFFSWLGIRLKSKPKLYDALLIIFGIALVIGGHAINNRAYYLLAVFCGFLVRKINFSVNNKKISYVMLTLPCMLLMVSTGIIANTLFCVLLGAIVFISLKSLNFEILDNPVISNCEKKGFSFSVYLYHWPIFCSVGCWLMCSLSNAVVGFWSAFLIVNASVILVSLTLGRLAEKLAVFVCKKIN